MRYKNLTIVGTSHIAQQSLDEVRQIVKDIRPDIIAVELDIRRFNSLMHDSSRKPSVRDIVRIGFKGYMFSIIGGWLQKKLGKMVGVMPGSEMKTAIEIAKTNKIAIALIDQDISITLSRFSKFLSWKEKFRFVWDFLTGIFVGKRELRKLGITNLDLTKVPSKKVIKALISKVKVRYPNVYKVLIHERNIFMGDKLLRLMKSNTDKTILAVLGAGHVDDVINYIKSKYNSMEVV